MRTTVQSVLPSTLLLTVAFSLTSAGVSQTNNGAPPTPTPRGRENLPWTRFHPGTPAPYVPTPDEVTKIENQLRRLDTQIRVLRTTEANENLLADVEIFAEAARWKLTFREEFFRQSSVADTLAVLADGLARADALKNGRSPWTTQRGQVVRGYRSPLDGSVQPLRVTVPDNYDGIHPVPLDVALHGRFTKLYEVETLRSWDGAEVDYLPGTLQIDLFGRGKNTYHWPGEADVFDAISFIKRSYKIDANKTLLRGFSMGGAGVWHLSLHFPDLWTAVEVGAGDNTSHRIPVLDTLPAYAQPMCKLFDNMYEWAINAFNVPFASYVGEKDRSLPKHNSAKAELIRLGLQFEGDPFSLKAVGDPTILFLVAPNTGHDMHPDSRRTLNAFLYERIKQGRQTPDHIRFTTFTTRYNRDYWVEVDGMGQHYARADVDATRLENGTRYQITTHNVSRLRLSEMNRASLIVLDGEALPLKPGVASRTFIRSNASWSSSAPQPDRTLRKQHGLQGPIDDAFLQPFLVVRPTGKPWNPAVNGQALRLLDRFAKQYAIAYRGHLRMKDDREVTADDVARYHLVLFGDGGSNLWIRRLSRKIKPLHWTGTKLILGTKQFSASTSMPALIYPNPANPTHYVVINSGLTADWKDWAGDFPTPRFGDFAVFDVREPSDDPHALYAGTFDESWRLQ